MGTTLTGTTPQDTYDSLIKVTDNGPLSGTAKYLSDGLGNDSALALSTSAVGIGTNSPSSGKLQVKGSGSTSGTNAIFVDNSVGAATFAIRDNGDAFLLGNVGIGTSSPDGKLDVASAGNLVSTGAFTNPHIALTLTASPVDNDTFAGITFPTSDSANYGWSMGAKRESGGNGYLEIRQHFNSATGTQIARFTGNGLCFGSDTAAANALDDYEEGTFDFAISFGGASAGITYTSRTGAYTKIGRQVTVNGYIGLSSKGSSTGTALIQGLPFTIGNVFANYSATSLFLKNVTFANQFMALGQINSTTIAIEESTEAGVVTGLTDADFANNSEIIVSFTYFV